MADLSAHILVANAVVDELNDGSRPWANSFEALRTWLPVYEPPELDVLRVSVVAVTAEIVQFDRGHDRHQFGLVIDFQRKVNPADRDQLDAIDRLVQDVQDFFADNHRLAGLTAWQVTDVQRPTVYDLPALYTDHTWETMLNLEVRGVRP